MGRSKKSEAKRASIRHAAYVCFREKGYHETSIDEICETAKISKGSFYWHYGAKIDVFGDILESWARQVVDELLDQFDAIPDDPSPITTLIEVLTREFRRARAIVPLWAEFTLHAQRDREVQVSLTKFYRRSRSAIVEILRRSAGDFLTEPQLQGAAAVILGAYAGLTMQDLADPQERSDQWVNDFLPVLGLLLEALQVTQGLSKIEPLPPTAAGVRETPERLGDFVEEGGRAAREVVMALREEVFKVAGDVDEKWIKGWRALAYGKEGLRCHLKLRKTAVELAFYEGVGFEDPDGVLKGSGKRRRHLSVPFDHENIPLGQVAYFLRQTFPSD